MAERPRVGITGLGLVSPLGNSVNTSWDRMLRGEHGITSLDTPFRYQGEDLIFVQGDVKALTQDILNPKEARRIHRSHLFSLVSTAEALAQAGFWEDGKLQGVKPEDIGAKIGTGIGGALDGIKVADAIRNDRGMRQLYALIVEPERVATVPSIAFGLRNSAHTSIAACATGGINIIEAYNRIALGQAQVMVAGSTEAALQPETFAIYDQVGALSKNKDPDFASTPFDENRSGFVAAEGSGIMVLENIEHAQARGAEVLAELVGVADTSDAADNTSPAMEGQVRAMNKALAWGGLTPAQIEYINAHGTGTPLGDRIELESIESVFGQSAYDIPISSLKWQLGHMVGAAASAEAVLGIKMLQEGVIIPNFGLRDPLRTDMQLITELQFRQIDVFMKNAFGFGGINSVLIFKRFFG